MTPASDRAAHRTGFSLIELLIGIAILSLLATIAVPNFLYAQTRARSARVKADLRTLATAVEAYTTDHNQPPLDWSVPRGDPEYPGMIGSTSGILHPGRADAGAPGGVRPGLTTPVAYVTDCWQTDPFVARESFDVVPFDQQKYTYNWFGPRQLRGATPNPDYDLQDYGGFYGQWRLGSIGPDRDYYNGGQTPYLGSRIYDPTNGILSSGNIWRSQKLADVRDRPPLDHVLDP